MDSHEKAFSEVASVPALVAGAWANAGRAALPALPWLALWALAGGFYKWALSTGTGGAVLTLAALVLVFVAGVLASLRIYRAMLPDAKGSFVQLAHVNLALYLAFFLIGFFVLFFVGAFGVAMLQMSGVIDLAASPDEAQMQAAFSHLLRTPYGVALVMIYATGMGGLAYLALRLLLVGAATVARGQAMVFRTWRWTKGLAARLGMAALATHVVPFALGALANIALIHAMGQSEPALFATGITGLALHAPFVLGGHGLAVALLLRLSPGGKIA
ncbi:MAG: hypothetical protein R3C13_08915 [Hyphomonas sp.]|uniref:hypothetical protein n=1 Tax=Hyphomonas sp. TaxID=87 RepID=UPI003528BC2A